DSVAGGRDNRAGAARTPAAVCRADAVVPRTSRRFGRARFALARAGYGRSTPAGAGARPPYETLARPHARPGGVSERLRRARHQPLPPRASVSTRTTG